MPIILGSVPASGLSVVSFTDIMPPVRYDNSPWIAVEIRQAPALAGPWTLIDSQALSPADGDPGDPQARNVTTSLATTQQGFFTLTFLDGSGAGSQPIMQVMNQPSEVRPSVAELGAFMRARTVVAGSGGEEAGTFTTSTRPTAVEAASIINDAVSAVLMDTGADIPERFITPTRFAVLVKAAQLVELTFYRNEVNRDQSAYAQYVDLYEKTVASLSKAISDDDAASPAPSFYSVPIASQSQQRFAAMAGALDPVTGRFDPSKLPVDEWYPRGPGGIPASLAAVFPWLGFDAPFGDMELTDLESPD